MTVLGFSGYAKSGKTAAAEYLVNKYGYERKHIAEPLRAMLAVLLRANGLATEMITRYLTGDLKEEMIPEIGATSRHCQITIGTEWGRECINPDLWADTWARGVATGDKVMNDSVRFVNEERVIQDDLEGITIMIERPGTAPIKFSSWLGEKLYRLFGWMRGVHDSERIDRLTPTYTIVNDGTLEDLYAELDWVMDHIDIVKATAIKRADNNDECMAALGLSAAVAMR
jgi:hypothetical protein